WDVFFWHHNVERGFGGSDALAAHPWWFYSVRASIDLLPWSIVAPIAVYGFVRYRIWRSDECALLGLIWFAAIAMLLSLMRFKRADYLLPAYPGFALFLGAAAERWWQDRAEATPFPIRAWALGSFMALYVAGWLAYGAFLVPIEERTAPYQS